MTDNWYRELDNSKLVEAVLLHFSAAFDVINHELLVAKLKCYGLPTIPLSWIESYLSGGKQRLYYNGCFSDSRNVYCAVPQGSCLGPLLYLVLTNDLLSVLDQTSMVIYADDSTMYYSALTC